MTHINHFFTLEMECVIRGNVRSAKCLFGEMSIRGDVIQVTVRRGNVLSGNCPFGELSVGEMSSGNCPSGKSSSGKCPLGNCPDNLKTIAAFLCALPCILNKQITIETKFISSNFLNMSTNVEKTSKSCPSQYSFL